MGTRIGEVWRYVERGDGKPLVLLHGIGMSHAAWNPVLMHLCPTRRVIAFDIAGFGATPPLPSGIPPTIHNLVDGLEQSVRAIGIDLPVDIAGNSLGALIALEAARRGIARAVVAISPPGLWRRRGAPHVKYVFRALRFMAKTFPRLSTVAMRMPWMREVVLSMPISIGSRRMPVRDARRAVEDLADATAFEATFDRVQDPYSATAITVPVTVAFGECDWILIKGSRRRDSLPAHARWIEPRGWGHVPMWVDSAGVSQLILEGTSAAAGDPDVTVRQDARSSACTVRAARTRS
jgi:pimeloyl-ACP methyl ester carboxylesterase